MNNALWITQNQTTHSDVVLQSLKDLVIQFWTNHTTIFANCKDVRCHIGFKVCNQLTIESLCGAKIFTRIMYEHFRCPIHHSHHGDHVITSHATKYHSNIRQKNCNISIPNNPPHYCPFKFTNYLNT